MIVRGTRQTRMEVAKTSLITVIRGLQGNVVLGVYLLNGGWLIPLEPLNKADAIQKINTVRASGDTKLGRAMKNGTDALLEARQKERYGNYRLVIVTDGEASDPKSVNQFINDIITRGITVDVIGVSMSQTHTLANKAHSYRSADDPDSLTKALSEVLAETGVSSDTAESDFELTSALPDEMVVSIIATLAESSVSNHPIGTQPTKVIAPANRPTDVSPPVTPTESLGSYSAMAVVMAILVFAFLIFIITIVFRM
jgi:uncharacterized protein YegL